ncbi:YfbM family protein [Chryseobacterium sp. ISL-6]|uniref:YfbM family protein n=1 Tax=Chryseobacterium sp. ISL-6 TaxID=2819143 RepID=UPI002035691F|nr:YfbM family protein [Chryseobacterium sp. ISL-6]
MIGNLLRVKESELENYLKDSSLLLDRINNHDTEDANLVDIDKAWDGIIFLLTGQSIINSNNHPLSKILFSEQIIDEVQDLGYGPAHYLTPSQVSELNTQISVITANSLKPNFDPAKMTEVYPSVWEEEDGAFEYLVDGFSVVQKTYAEAAKNGEAMITFLS